MKIESWSLSPSRLLSLVLLTERVLVSGSALCLLVAHELLLLLLLRQREREKSERSKRTVKRVPLLGSMSVSVSISVSLSLLAMARLHPHSHRKRVAAAKHLFLSSVSGEKAVSKAQAGS